MINKTGKYVNIKDYIIGLSILLTYIDTLYSYQQPSDINIYLGNPSEYCDNEAPYFHGKIDSAGFSDWIWYGKSPNHPYGSHELLSGEWGAAIYYDNIDTNPIVSGNPNSPLKSMWLTNKFIYPDWYTNSDFTVPDDPNIPTGYWHDPNNTVPYYNAARTLIENNQIQIQIDYEVVDLEYRDPNLYPVRSPMAVWDETKDLTQNN